MLRVLAADDEAPALEELTYLLRRHPRIEHVKPARDAAAHRETAPYEPETDEVIPVELGGRTRLISRADVTHAETQGDYIRLHTADGSYLLRMPLAALEERWRAAGFIRIHRKTLVSAA